MGNIESVAFCSGPTNQLPCISLSCITFNLIIDMIGRQSLRSLLTSQHCLKKMAETATTRSFHHQTVVSGPPRNPTSTLEKIGHCSFIMFTFFAIPAWILAHMKEYQK